MDHQWGSIGWLDTKAARALAWLKRKEHGAGAAAAGWNWYVMPSTGREGEESKGVRGGDGRREPAVVIGVPNSFARHPHCRYYLQFSDGSEFTGCAFNNAANQQDAVHKIMGVRVPNATAQVCLQWGAGEAPGGRE